MQYRYFQQKYGELFARAWAKREFESNKDRWMRVGRYVTAGLTLSGITSASGVTLWHLGGRNIILGPTPQARTLYDVTRHLYHGDFEKAAMELGRFMAPMGHTLTRKTREGEIEFKAPLPIEEGESKSESRKVRY